MISHFSTLSKFSSSGNEFDEGVHTIVGSGHDFDKGLTLFGSLKTTNVSHFGAMGLDFNEYLILWGPGA